MNVVVMGLRGSGKSTVGRLLASQLGWEFVDTDARVMARAGQSIRQLFEEHGEEAFRRAESAEIELAAKHDRQVIAVGGGALMSDPNGNALRAGSTFVWLRGRPETLAARVAVDPRSTEQRPALTSLAARDEIEHLMSKRDPVFRRIADLVVNTDDRPPERVADEILTWLVRQGIVDAANL